MSKDKRGYILLYRNIQDHWLWTSNKPFDDRSAWIDLLMLANHETKKIGFNKGFIYVKRGQYLTSQRKLSERWGWSRDRTNRYIKRLKMDGMLYTDCDTHKTLLTIVNYDNFQGTRNTDKAIDKDTDKDTDKATNKAQTNNINNYIKNEERIEPPSGGGEWQ